LLIAVWSLVHGFSHLALGGELSIHGAQNDVIMTALLPTVLQYLPAALRGSA